MQLALKKPILTSLALPLCSQTRLLRHVGPPCTSESPDWPEAPLNELLPPHFLIVLNRHGGHSPRGRAGHGGPAALRLLWQPARGEEMKGNVLPVKVGEGIRWQAGSAFFQLGFSRQKAARQCESATYVCFRGKSVVLNDYMQVINFLISELPKAPSHIYLILLIFASLQGNLN